MEYNLLVMQMEVIIDDKLPVLNRDIDSREFYELLRTGAVYLSKTVKGT